VKHFFELSSEPPTFDAHHGQMAALGHQLYQWLLAPFTRSQALPKNLILVPDGVLNLISFDALCSGPQKVGNDRYRDLPFLIYDHIISYGNSAGLLAEQGAIENEQHNGQCIGFAWSNGKSPDPGKGLGREEQWPDLPGTATEMDVVRKFVQGKYYLGPDAKESTFKSETQPYGILHIALHGTAGEAEPSLIFPVAEDGQEDGILNLNEMYGMRFHAELAVLSACESGVGVVHNEEGLLSMARGFLFAGIPTVVTNLWEVEDRAAHMITGDFYASLSQGKSVAEALRQARIAYIQQAPNSNASPFFWASYVSLGKSGPVQLAIGQSQSNRWEWWLVGAMGILVAFFFRYYQRNRNRKSLS
jgi:CHAT domain-containing protein